MAIEIVDLPIDSMVIFHSYVNLPGGILKLCNLPSIYQNWQWFSHVFRWILVSSGKPYNPNNKPSAMTHQTWVGMRVFLKKDFDPDPCCGEYRGLGHEHYIHIFSRTDNHNFPWFFLLLVSPGIVWVCLKIGYPPNFAGHEFPHVQWPLDGYTSYKIIYPLVI